MPPCLAGARRVLLLPLLGALCLPAPARCDTPAEPAPPPLRPVSRLGEDLARRVVLEMDRAAGGLRAAGEPGQALALYQAAYQVLPSSLLLWQMAELHLALQQPVAGLIALHRYEELSGPPPAYEAGAPIGELRRKLRAQVAMLRLHAPPSELVVDGRPTMEPAVRLDPGEHRVEVRGPLPYAQVLRLGPGEVRDLTLPEPAPKRRWYGAELTPGRAALAGVLAGLFTATLLTAVALNGEDGKARPGGCVIQGASYADCNYHFTAAYGVTYAGAGVLLAGVGLTLFVPKPRF